MQVIQPDSVRLALHSIRRGQPVESNPLLEMKSFIAFKINRGEGGTLQRPDRLLPEFLESSLQDAISESRGNRASNVSYRDLGNELDLRMQLQADFNLGDTDLDALLILYVLTFSHPRQYVRDFAKFAHWTDRTLARRQIHGVLLLTQRLNRQELTREATSDTFTGLVRPTDGHYLSCFISYSSTDQAFADRLYNDLSGAGVRTWFAPHDLRGGKKLHEQIDEAIRGHDRLLLVVSESSCRSDWVRAEIIKAVHREIEEQRRVLFPIRLVGYSELHDWTLNDPMTGRDLAAEVREYYVPDFSHWSDAIEYQAAFDRLLQDLRLSYS